MNRALLTTVPLLALALSACAVGPDFTPPKAPAVNTYGGNAPDKAGIALGKTAPAAWWTSFRSDKLDKVVAMALAANHDLAASRANLAAMRAQVDAAESGLYPHLAATAGAARNKEDLAQFGFKMPPPVFDLYSVGGEVSYSLDLFGKTRRAIEAADAQADAGRYELSAASLAVAGNVATQAFSIAMLRAQTAAAEDMVKAADQSVALARLSEQRGYGSHLDLLMAETQAAASRARLPALRQQLTMARHALAVLVGKGPGEWQAPDFDLADFTLPAPLPVSLTSALVHQRPDILAAEAMLHEASAKVGVATAQAYPDITLSASVLQGAFEPHQLFSSGYGGAGLGVGILAPLFEGGAIEANRKSAVAGYNAAVALYEQTVVQGLNQTADLLEAVQHGRQGLAAAETANSAAQQAFAMARASYQAGEITLPTLLEAQNHAAQARQSYAEARAQLLTTAARLFVATGAGWEQALKPQK